MKNNMFNIGWGLTSKCNMYCRFCYSEKIRQEAIELEINDWKKFVDRNHQYIDAINYGTGENAMLDNFYCFVEYLRKNYPAIGQALTTNGSISERVQKNPYFMKIFVHCIDEVDVSIDFNDREKHGIFRGQPKAFEWANHTLQLCKELRKLTTIVFVGCDETVNKDNLDGLFDLANKYDALLRMNIYRPVSNKEDINNKFILSYENLKLGLQYIHDKYEIVSLSDALLGNIFVDQGLVKDYTGTNSIRVLPDGTICPSTYLINADYRDNVNINNVDLGSLKFAQFEDVETPKECRGCVHEDSCKGGVYDRRILWYGTLAERDPYCPTRHDDGFPLNPFYITKNSRTSIHDGYLPTLFFKNREK
jgi:radical SAM protein with 4Fe4S-binding SPASM domain